MLRPWRRLEHCPAQASDLTGPLSSVVLVDLLWQRVALRPLRPS
jgi:hypothetical protein